MSAAPSLGVPELAGVCTYDEAARPGRSVEASVTLLRRLDYVERRLYEIASLRLAATPEWEVKCGLSLHLHLDAEHSTAIRTRITEMRSPPLHLDVCPDDRLGAWMDEVLHAADTIELLAGIYAVVRPALLEGYERYMAESHPLVDFPTRRALRLPIAEEREAIEWGRAAWTALAGAPDDRERAERWIDHLRRYLAAAGGIPGDVPVPGEPPPARAVGPYVPDFRPSRDRRFSGLYNFNYRPSFVARDPSRPVAERNLALMYKRLHEMDVPEMMACLIAETPGRPWDYYRDMGRQLWDECRHAMMGEIWFETHGIDWTRTPNHVGWSLLMNADRTPRQRHAVLFSVEHGLMARSGKRAEWELARESGDPLSGFFQDFDWADEVLHKRIGLRWLKAEIGDVDSILAVAEAANAESYPHLAAEQSAHAQDDWWPEFVRESLGEYVPGGVGEVSIQKGGLSSLLGRTDATSNAAELAGSSG